MVNTALSTGDHMERASTIVAKRSNPKSTIPLGVSTEPFPLACPASCINPSLTAVDIATPLVKIHRKKPRNNISRIISAKKLEILSR